MIIMNMIGSKLAINQDGSGAIELNVVDIDSKIAITTALAPEATIQLVEALAESLTDEQKKHVAGKFETSKLVLPDRDFKVEQVNGAVK